MKENSNLSKLNELVISFEGGTLLIQGEQYPLSISTVKDCLWDKRSLCYRVPAYRYYELIYYLINEKIKYKDLAKKYNEINFSIEVKQEKRNYQIEALKAWIKNNRRGYIVLPTGAGKSYIGILAIENVKRSTIIVVPTIDLVNQWYDMLKFYFSTEIGLIGGGYYEIKDLTVITYDSFYIHVDKLGNRFGFIIFDECHHLPGESYAISAKCAIAPFRLGLSATPERADGRHILLDDLIGPCAYYCDIRELSGDYLANYETIRIYVELSKEEKDIYIKARTIYKNFLSKHGIQISQPDGWKKFLRLICKSEEGRETFKAYRLQKNIAQASSAKIKILGFLLKQHHKDRILIFTNDNETVYTISKTFLTPSITHQTKTKERLAILKSFAEGEYPILVTSKVLNEGINVPDANVGIIISGSGSVREHVQRLGRILRKQEGKEALLYEVITKDTGEEFISDRRREHEAYQ